MVVVAVVVALSRVAARDIRLRVLVVARAAFDADDFAAVAVVFAVRETTRRPDFAAPVVAAREVRGTTRR